MINRRIKFFILGFVGLAMILSQCIAQAGPHIFPIPLSEEMGQEEFRIDNTAFIAIPQRVDAANGFPAMLLQHELADKYGCQVQMLKKVNLKGNDKFILIGSISNPLIRTFCEQKALLPVLKNLGEEGYILSVTKDNIVIAGNSEKGAMWGLSSLRQLISRQDNQVTIRQVLVKDAPAFPFRGIKLYLPGKENLQFFKRFIKDFVVLYKYNKIILELNANMRLDKHPELNVGAVQFANHLKYSRLDRPPGVHKEYQNSSHQDNADGQILEKEDVADIVSYMRRFNIEVIPELPSLTHSYYLLAGHEDLAENMNQPYPDTYCPLKPGSYKLYFDVLDEYIDVIHPSIIHVGHDEWRMEKDICMLCRGKDYGQLYAEDLKKIHDHLAAKGIKTAIWGDHLLESVTEKDHQTWKSSTGYTYKIPGALRLEQVMKLVPKDILIFNWFWNDVNNDRQLSAFGFKQVYGNMRADINNWSERDKIRGTLGGAPSSWAATTELNIGKDQLYDFLGCANLLWSKTYLAPDKLAFEVEPRIAGIHADLSGKKLPVDCGASVVPLDISSCFNSSAADVTGNAGTITGIVKSNRAIFNINSYSKENNAIIVNALNVPPRAISINKDVSSLIFLHACSKEALNNKAYDMIYNFDDTAEPLAWYEVVYEDGIVETIPIRYGVNILDYGWRNRIIKNEKEKGKYSQNKYAYEASAVDCAKDDLHPVTFFSFEWENPRYGKAIREIRLKPIEKAKGNDNSVMLLALSISENIKIASATGTEAQ